MSFADSTITITACGSQNRETWPVHGLDQGKLGVVLGKGQVEGVYDAPIKAERRSAARQRGGTLVNVNYGVREINLGFHVAGPIYGGPDYYAATDGNFRNSFAYEPDRWDEDWEPTRIDWETNLSGTRSLDVLLRDVPDFNPEVDSLVNEYGNPILPLAADQPFWYEPPVITTWSTSSTSGSGFITVSNPTDVPMFQKWILTRGRWLVPDVSWRGARGRRFPGGPYHDRMVETLTVTSTHGGLTIDMDPMELMVRDANDTNALGQMPVPGQFFMHEIPPYTPPTQLPIAVSSAPAGVGAMAQLVQPRLWSKPFGLEIPMVTP